MHHSAAILRTVLYADLFDCALSEAELYHKLQTPKPVSKAAVKTSLTQLVNQRTLTTSQGFYALAQRRFLIADRVQKLQVFTQKQQRLEAVVPQLAMIPWIEAIYLTGSLAARNGDHLADMDILIITKPHRLWLVRLMIILLSEWHGYRRRPGMTEVSNRFCFNLFLDHSSLLIPKRSQNLYTAHEVIQATLLYERAGVHAIFLKTNAWVRQFLPHSLPAKFAHSSQVPTIFKGGVVERAFDWLNYGCYLLQWGYMIPRRTTESVSIHHAFFHPRNTSGEILQRFKARKKQFGLVQ